MPHTEICKCTIARSMHGGRAVSHVVCLIYCRWHEDPADTPPIVFFYCVGLNSSLVRLSFLKPVSLLIQGVGSCNGLGFVLLLGFLTNHNPEWMNSRNSFPPSLFSSKQLFCFIKRCFWLPARCSAWTQQQCTAGGESSAACIAYFTPCRWL